MLARDERVRKGVPFGEVENPFPNAIRPSAAQFRPTVRVATKQQATQTPGTAPVEFFPVVPASSP
eukprot:3710175-Pyramimonas_sp.AAC.1